eukprot:4678499-Amphidinium_carterae.1
MIDFEPVPSLQLHEQYLPHTHMRVNEEECTHMTGLGRDWPGMSPAQSTSPDLSKSVSTGCNLGTALYTLLICLDARLLLSRELTSHDVEIAGITKCRVNRLFASPCDDAKYLKTLLGKQ